MDICLLLGTFATLRKATISIVMCVCLFNFLVEQLDSYGMDFHQIRH